MKTINLIVPRGWHELDDKQLRYLFGLLADDYSSAEIRTLCLLRWSGLKVLQKYYVSVMNIRDLFMCDYFYDNGYVFQR